MFPQAHIPAGKTALHLCTVHLSLSIVSQSLARTFLGVSGVYLGILAQDVILMKSDGMETTGPAHHLQEMAREPQHCGLLLVYTLAARLRSQEGQCELQEDCKEGKKTAFLPFPLSEEQ